MKFQYLIEILFLLLSRKVVTAKYLADRLGVSKRTIYRYMDDLALAKIPVISDRGVEGGYYIPDSFKLPATFLTQDEFSKLNSAIMTIESQLGGDELSKIMEKLSSATKIESIENLTSQQLIIDASDWSTSSTYKNKLSIITGSIQKCKTLKICYHDREGNITVRQIEPHALALKQGLWYVYAYCSLRRDFRLFKIGRIEYAMPTGEKFQKREFDASQLPFNKWYNSMRPIQFDFEISQSIKSDIEEWLGIENVHTLANGKILASAKLPYDKGLVYQIMKYGSNIRVLNPKSIRDEIVQEANLIIELYNKKTGL